MKHSWMTALLLSVAMAAPAIADTTVCYPRDQMLSFIARDYAAEKRVTGVVRPYSIMEIWVSHNNDDWLIVTTDLDGSSCIVAYGEDFALTAHPSDEPKAGEG